MGNLFSGWGGFIDLFCTKTWRFNRVSTGGLLAGVSQESAQKQKLLPTLTLQFAEWSYISRVVERNYATHVVLNQCFYNFYNFLIGGNVTHRKTHW